MGMLAGYCSWMGSCKFQEVRGSSSFCMPLAAGSQVFFHQQGVSCDACPKTERASSTRVATRQDLVTVARAARPII